MNWDDLRVFLALSRSRTLAAAARTLGQDATTVARRVQRLEKALETNLFEHSTTGQRLTESGQRLLAHAEMMETSARSVQQQVGTGAMIGGSIRVSASEGFGSWFIAPRLTNFMATHPGISIDLMASTGFLNPSRREADIAIMLARPRAGPLIALKLTDYRLGAYAAKTYLQREGAIDNIDELTTRRLVGYVPDFIYAPELRYLAEIDERLEAQIRSTSINAQAHIIESGAGCGILPCFMGDLMPEVVRLFSDDIAITRSFWLVVHQDMRRVARMQYFIEWLKTEIALAHPLLMGETTGNAPESHTPSPLSI